jgi:phage virion morphogenesis protein
MSGSKFKSGFPIYIQKLKGRKTANFIIAQIMVEDIRQNFIREQSPEGKKWDILSKGTIRARREGPNKGQGKAMILRNTGKLFENIVGEASDEYALAGVTAQVPYGKYHQFGMGNNPERKFIGISPRGVKKIERAAIETLKPDGI